MTKEICEHTATEDYENTEYFEEGADYVGKRVRCAECGAKGIEWYRYTETEFDEVKQ